MPDGGRVRWFGESWGSPVCAPEQHAETPAGAACAGCQQTIRVGQQGLLIASMGSQPCRVPYHLDCFLREIGARLMREVVWEEPT